MTTKADGSTIDNTATVSADGETLTYTLVVTNNGPAPASNVEVVDVLPNGVTIESASASQGLCISICDLGDLAVGASASVTITVTVDSSQTGTLTNYARVSASNPDSDASNNEVNTTTTIDVDDTLAISKVGPATVGPNEAIAYQMVVNNTGPSDGTNVVVSDTRVSVRAGQSSNDVRSFLGA